MRSLLLALALLAASCGGESSPSDLGAPPLCDWAPDGVSCCDRAPSGLWRCSRDLWCEPDLGCVAHE